MSETSTSPYIVKQYKEEHASRGLYYVGTREEFEEAGEDWVAGDFETYNTAYNVLRRVNRLHSLGHSHNDIIGIIGTLSNAPAL